MGANFENMDGTFRKQLRDYSQTAPESVWNSIEESLNQHTKAKRITFYKVAAAIAAFALLGSTFLYFATNDKQLKNTKIIAKETESAKLQEETVNAKELDVDRNQNDMQVANESAQPKTKEFIAKADVTNKEPELKNKGILIVEEKDSKEITTLKKLAQVRVAINNSQVHAEIVDTRKQKIKAILNTLPSIYDNSYALNIVDADNEDQKSNKWVLGGEFSPLYSYRNITSTSGAYGEDYYNSTEKPVMTYSGGLNLQYKAIDRLTIQAGVYYTTMGQSLDYMAVYSNANYYIVDEQYKDRFVNSYAIENSAGEFAVRSEYVIVDNKATRVENLSSSKGEADVSDPIYNNLGAEMEQQFQYVEVPFLMRYKVIDRTLDVNILGGFGANFLVGNDVLLNYGSTKEVIGTINGLNAVNYTGTIGFGIEYPVMKRINIHLEPSFRYYLNEMNSNSTVESHPYSIGIFTGINYSF
jgi:hypothetical protein